MFGWWELGYIGRFVGGGLRRGVRAHAVPDDVVEAEEHLRSPDGDVGKDDHLEKEKERRE